MPLRRLRRGARACALAVLLALPAAAPALAATSGPAGYRPFAPDSIWNARLAPDEPLHPRSAQWASFVARSVATDGAYINSTTCSMPIFWAAAGTPTVAVALNNSHQDPALVRAWSTVPMPPDAAPANCQDRNLAVYQQQPDGTVRSWELWQAVKAADGSWSARWGGANSDVQADAGVGSALQWQDPLAPDPLARTSHFQWNVTASSIPMSAGVVTLDDLDRGVIDHALSMAVHDAAAGSWLWPAQRTDGGSTDPAAIPEGARLRLDPTLDLSTRPMTPLVRMLAQAAQRYGIVVRDRTSSANVFYVQPPAAGQPNPVRPMLDGGWPDKAITAFPWDRLQVLDAPTCTPGVQCRRPDRAVLTVGDAAPAPGAAVALDATGSRFDQPVTGVAWDLDGDGTFERATGRSLTTTWTPDRGGAVRVAVRVSTRGGATTTTDRLVTVRAPGQTVTARPTTLSTTYFYAYSASDSALSAITGRTVAPAAPPAGQKLYTASASGSATATFGAATAAAGATAATVRAYVQCGTRCLRLQVLDGAGAVRATTTLPAGTSGWVSLACPPAAPGAYASLALKATATGGAGATGRASVTGVQADLTVGG